MATFNASHLETLQKRIFDTCWIEGDFLLRSGQRSSRYFDKYRLESNPALLGEVAKAMANLIPKDCDYLAGLEIGGIPLATALSLHTGIPAVFVRKKAKEYGTCQLAEGASIQGKRLVVIEDVITTGGQVALSTQDLRRYGAQLKSVLCVLYRGKLSDPNLEPAFAGLDLSIQPLFKS